MHILLMSNSARTTSAPKYIFDLKGSMINRECKGEKINLPGGGTLKDINLLDICKGEHWLLLQQKDRKSIMELIQSDIKFLGSHRLMDYSLLVIIEENVKW